MTELSIDPNEEQNHKGCHADWPQAVRELAGFTSIQRDSSSLFY